MYFLQSTLECVKIIAQEVLSMYIIFVFRGILDRVSNCCFCFACNLSSTCTSIQFYCISI